MTKTIYRCLMGDFEDGHQMNALRHVQTQHPDVKNPHELILERDSADLEEA